MSKRKVVVRFNKKMPMDYHAIGDLHLVDNKGTTLMEVRGITEFGKKKSKKNKFDGKFIGQYRDGNNKITWWEDHYGNLSFTVAGGVHKVRFNQRYRSRRKHFLISAAKYSGFKVNKNKKGEYRIYVGKII
jgi:hypothetical protein